MLPALFPSILPASLNVENPLPLALCSIESSSAFFFFFFVRRHVHSFHNIKYFRSIVFVYLSMRGMRVVLASRALFGYPCPILLETYNVRACVRECGSAFPRTGNAQARAQRGRRDRLTTVVRSARSRTKRRTRRRFEQLDTKHMAPLFSSPHSTRRPSGLLLPLFRPLRFPSQPLSFTFLPTPLLAHPRCFDILIPNHPLFHLLHLLLPVFNAV